MASVDLSIGNAFLPSALANAALLIAAPSLGCLNTYTKAITDLYSAYSLPVPDFTSVLQYNKPSLSSSTIVDPPFIDCGNLNPGIKASMKSPSVEAALSDGRNEEIPTPLETIEPIIDIKSEYAESEFIEPELNLVEDYTRYILETNSQTTKPINIQDVADSHTKKRADYDYAYETNKRKRCFQSSWLNEYDWLTYDEEKDLMFCSVCVEFNHLLSCTSNIKVKLVEGSNRFRKTSLDSHQTSMRHMDAINAKMKFMKEENS